MIQEVKPGELQPDAPRRERRARRWVLIFQILFMLVLLLDLDGPFLSAHNERQNQTFDMSRHVFRDGWRSVITPKVSYSGWGFEKQPYTAALLEVPFHGLIGWPLALVTSHERAVTRLISTAFALLSIQLMYGIMRFWLPAAAAAAGAGVWATAPLILHFGQIPMPDIICTAGLLAAFWFALRGNLAASSGSFLFTLLAKLSVIVFGLPILTALLVARQCRTKRDFVRISIVWGWLPLCGLLLWEYVLYHFAPPTRMSVMQIMSDRGSWSNLVRFTFNKFVFGTTVGFGLGVLGCVGLFFAAREKGHAMNPWVKWAIIGANVFFFLFVIRKVPEPQYLLPTLAWCVMAAGFGFSYLIETAWSNRKWRMALGAGLVLHLAVAALLTIDLKASRVPNFADIQHVAKLLPADARVLVLYRYYGASPAVWLDRNVLAVGVSVPSMFPGACEVARRAGFTHLLILDIESWHDDASKDGPLALAMRLFDAVRKKPPVTGANLPSFASLSSPFRQYCDQAFSPLYVAPHVVLYAMVSPPEQQQLEEKTGRPVRKS